MVSAILVYSQKFIGTFLIIGQFLCWMDIVWVIQCSMANDVISQSLPQMASSARTATDPASRHRSHYEETEQVKGIPGRPRFSQDDSVSSWAFLFLSFTFLFPSSWISFLFYFYYILTQMVWYLISHLIYCEPLSVMTGPPGMDMFDGQQSAPVNGFKIQWKSDKASLV